MRLSSTMGRALVVCALAAAIGGAIFATTASGAGTAGGTLVIRSSVDWPNFDLFSNTIAGNMEELVFGYERLMGRAAGFKPVPYLGTPTQVTPKSITFQIRKGATCADGTPVTAQVVGSSLKALIESPHLSNFLLDAWGAGPYGVAVDPKKQTVTFRTGTPFGLLEYGFMHPGTGIVCPAGLKARAADPHALETQMYGSGPYTLVSANHADQVVFKLRPEWKSGPQGTTAKDLSDTVVIKVVGDDATAANLMLTGGLNVAVIGSANAPRLASDKTMTHKAFRNYFFTPLILSEYPDHITNDETLRAALVTAVDPKNWIQAAYDGDGIASPGPLIPGMACYSSPAERAAVDAIVKKYAPVPSIDKAKQILTGGGYRYQGSTLIGKSGDPVKLRVVTTTSMNLGPEYLLNTFKQLGIDVDLSNTDGATYSRNVILGNFDVAVSSAPQPLPFLGPLIYVTAGPSTTQGGRNRANTAAGDPVLNREVRLALGTLGAESCKHWYNVERLYFQKHYLVGLGASTTHVFGKGVKPTFVGSSDYFEPSFIRPA
jgi:peptide/nickel transport system substrate-binding protein